MTVLERGFEYTGQVFRSLSGIAREITGTPWNGFAFFGLKDRGREAAAELWREVLEGRDG